LRLCLSVFKALHTFVLSKYAGIGPYLRKKGEWAGQCVLQFPGQSTLNINDKKAFN
jgi:hypothetical protein